MPAIEKQNQILLSRFELNKQKRASNARPLSLFYILS